MPSSSSTAPRMRCTPFCCVMRPTKPNMGMDMSGVSMWKYLASTKCSKRVSDSARDTHRSALKGHILALQGCLGTLVCVAAVRQRIELGAACHCRNAVGMSERLWRHAQQWRHGGAVEQVLAVAAADCGPGVGGQQGCACRVDDWRTAPVGVHQQLSGQTMHVIQGACSHTGQQSNVQVSACNISPPRQPRSCTHHQRWKGTAFPRTTGPGCVQCA